MAPHGVVLESTTEASGVKQISYGPDAGKADSQYCISRIANGHDEIQPRRRPFIVTYLSSGLVRLVYSLSEERSQAKYLGETDAPVLTLGTPLKRRSFVSYQIPVHKLRAKHGTNLHLKRLPLQNEVSRPQ